MTDPPFCCFGEENPYLLIQRGNGYKYLHNTYHVPGSFLHILHSLLHNNYMKWIQLLSHFTEVETKAQRG